MLWVIENLKQIENKQVGGQLKFHQGTQDKTMFKLVVRFSNFNCYIL